MTKTKRKYKTTKVAKNQISERKQPYWTHAGGKLLEEGAESLSDAELLSIFIGTGVKGKSAEKIAEDIMSRFGSFKGLANQPFDKLLAYKGLGIVKTVRIAAAFEMARRIVIENKKVHE